MSIKLEPPQLTELRPRIVVIGVGGAGGNAINNMIASGLTGVEYVAANTDAQALANSSAERRLQLGVSITEGLGAGARPEIGHAAAEETLEEIRAEFAGAHMAFIAAGMGGGTGTGAAAVIAKTVKEMGILTVGIVSKPFQFEGTRRMRVAEAGIEELRKHVDTLIVIPNQNLFLIANDRTTFAEAFVLADQILYSGIACIVDLILKDGLINLDFADVRTIMSGMGTAVMGTGEAEGTGRATLAAEEAIANPLLDDINLADAQGVLISIVGGPDMTLFEVDEAVNRIRREVDTEANIIVGAAFDTEIGGRIRVSILASGMDSAHAAVRSNAQQPGAIDADSAEHTTAANQAPGTVSQTASQPTGGSADFGEGAPPPLPASLLFAMDPADPGHAVRFPGGAKPNQHHDAHQPSQSAKPAAARAAKAQNGMAAAENDIAPDWGPADANGGAGAAGYHTADGVYVEPIGRERATRAAQSEPGAAAAPENGGFQPQAPREIRRPATRMPAVEEFGQHVQREYYAKAGGNEQNVASRPRAGAAGLFGRLSGLSTKGESVAREGGNRGKGE